MAPAEMSAFVAQLGAGAAAALPGGLTLTNIEAIGEGSYANVFRADARGDARLPGRVALKLTAPASVWEFYIQRALAARLVPAAAGLFMPALALFVGQDGDSAADGARRPRRPALRAHCDDEDVSGRAGALVMPVGEHGTLLDLANAHIAADRDLGDRLLLYLALQLLQVCPSAPRPKQCCAFVGAPDRSARLLAPPESRASAGGRLPRDVVRRQSEEQGRPLPRADAGLDAARAHPPHRHQARQLPTRLAAAPRRPARYAAVVEPRRGGALGGVERGLRAAHRLWPRHRPRPARRRHALRGAVADDGPAVPRNARGQALALWGAARSVAPIRAVHMHL